MKKMIVIPAKAGTQLAKGHAAKKLGPGLRRGDGSKCFVEAVFTPET